MATHKLLYWSLRLLVATIAAAPLVPFGLMALGLSTPVKWLAAIMILVWMILVWMIPVWIAVISKPAWRHKGWLADWCWGRYPPSDATEQDQRSTPTPLTGR